MTARRRVAAATLATAPADGAVVALPHEAPIALPLPPVRRPRSRRALVVRDRLVRALAGPDDVPLRVVVAPAGYGKTTVLGQWAERSTYPFAWITATRAHDDPARLLTDVVQALDALEPVDDAVLTALLEPRPAIGPVVLPLLARSLAMRATPFVLVVDEAEHLERRAPLEMLATLAAALPPGCVLALASRREPALPLGRLRARRDVVELRARELAMTRGEARDMLRAAGLRLDPAQVDLLVERTEGWPAGLHLAALALREQPDISAAVRRFAGDDRLVADYLRDELLSQLPAADVAFLTATSPLAELTGPLCDAVLGEHGSGIVLRDLARSNLLVAPLDRTEERFHCHALLADALRADLRRAEPERAAEVHRRASDWYAANGEAEHAIEHAIAAGDAARAGRLIWQVAPGEVAHGRTAAVIGWLGRLGDRALAREPELALAAAAVHATRADRDMAERWALIAAALIDRLPTARRDDLDAGVALMRAIVARDGLDRMREDALRAAALEREDSPWRALCCLLAGAADLFSGERAAGIRLLEEGSRRGAMGAPHAQVLCLALLALVALMDEQWEHGGRLAELARAQVERVGLRDDGACALVFAVSAFARAHRGRAEEAHADVRDAQRLQRAPGGASPCFEAATLLALARAELRLGDVLASRALLADGEAALRKAPDAGALRTWLQASRGRVEAFADDAPAGLASLTAAELRVLSYLPSHLPFRGIAAELCVSANTVKTQAQALYRKLDASSRSEAVTRAAQLGLLTPG